MKKLIMTAALAVVCIFTAACSGTFADDARYESAASAYDVLEKLIIAANEYEARDDAEYLEDGLIYRADSDIDGEFLTDGQKAYFYSTAEGDPDFSGVSDYALWTAAASSSTEMGVFKAKDKASAEVIESFVRERLNTMCENAEDYNAGELEKAENALVSVKGLYVIYISTFINEELDAVADEAILAKAVSEQ